MYMCYSVFIIIGFKAHRRRAQRPGPAGPAQQGDRTFIRDS